MNTPSFHVVQHEPEIPNNTGNIGRTCVATGCALHLIRPLAFDVSEKACRRAGLDYWPRLNPTIHDSFDEYWARERPPGVWLFSTRGRRSVLDPEVQFQRGDHLIFGSETRGLPEALLQRFPDRVLVLPMMPGERSLNVATAVCAVVYLGLSRLIARGEVALGSDLRLVPGAANGVARASPHPA